MPKAKYDDIYRDLKKKISGGVYPYSKLLPSENTLINIYDCSRNTVRRALAGLIRDGYVQAIHGKGVRVIYKKTKRASFSVGSIESFKETAARNNLKIVTRVETFSETTIGKKLSRETGLPEGEEVYYIRRIRSLNGKALILDVNIFLKSIVPDMTREIAENSIYDYIENEIGMKIVTSKRIITVEHATELDERLLDMGDYNCLAVVTGQTFNADGVMFEYTQSRHQPEHFSFQDTATRKRS